MRLRARDESRVWVLRYLICRTQPPHKNKFPLRLLSTLSRASAAAGCVKFSAKSFVNHRWSRASTEYCPMVMVMATYRALVAMPHRKFKAPQSVSVIICIELNLLRNTFSLTVKESERMIGRSDRPTSTTSRQGKSIYGESRSFDRRRRPLCLKFNTACVICDSRGDGHGR